MFGQCYLRPHPANFIEGNIRFFIHNAYKQPFLCAVGNPVLGCEFVPCYCAAFMDRIDYPPCMVFSRLYTAVINSEICAEFEGCLDYVSPVPYVLVNRISYPQIRLCLSCLLCEFLRIYFLVFPVKKPYPAFSSR